MFVAALTLRDFRSYARAEIRLGPGLNVIHGPNGAGKTNLLEALYFGCTGRSCRTSNERELPRFGEGVTRVRVTARDPEHPDAEHELSVGFAPGEAKRLQHDGADVDRLVDVVDRPLVSVFLPDRLELVKGPPALRRAHLDQVVAGLWPLRSVTRRAYAQALAQRNALLARLRTGRGAPDSLDAWDAELARHALALMADRAEAAALVAPVFPAQATALGLTGTPELRYRPRSTAADAEAFVAELRERRASEIDRGFSAHGPHRDELLLSRDGRELRVYGSQGEQRLSLLALLLSERAVLARERGRAPVMLLDDVMSELDAERRRRLVEELGNGGQSVITTTDLAHVPGADAAGVTRLRVADGTVLQEALAA
jgi:DNA replication and repair protein RecF